MYIMACLWRVFAFVMSFGLCYCVNPQDTVYEVLQRTQGLSKFESLVRKANLVSFFQYENRYTIFAPNDTAFENLTPDRKLIVDSLNGTKLQNFVKFHVLEGQQLMTGDFQDKSVKMSMSSARLYLNRREASAVSGYFGPTTYFVNGAMVSPEQKDLVGINGVVHGLMIWIDETSDKVGYKYIQEPDDARVKSTKFFTEILNKLAMSGQYYGPINDLNRYDGRMTLFVPSDEAITRIPNDKLRDLQQDVQRLHEVVKYHYIDNDVLFTTYVNHNQGFYNSNRKPMTIRKPHEYKAYVYSGGVTSEIMVGNITVVNGVLHVCDRLLGYVYFTVRQQIAEDSPLFDQLINRAPEETRKALVDPTNINVFVPTQEAFNKILRVPWVNLIYDTALVDKILRLHILQAGQTVTVSSLVGGYESREFKESLISPNTNPTLTVYRQRNETWVQGDTVVAKIVTADVAATNGKIQYIDTILGIPYLDLNNLICSDLWLLRTYDYMRAVGMKNYLRDPRFYSQECIFESQGYPPNYGVNNEYQGVYTTIRPSTSPAWDMGHCGSTAKPCTLTFFAPNSTAIDAFSRRDIGQKIMKNAYLLQNLFKRLLFPQKIELETLANTNYNFRAVNGDMVRISKYADRFVTLYYQNSYAKIIHMDNGATNGIVHIIDDFLVVDTDVTISAASQTYYHTFIIISCLIGWILM